MPNLDLVNTAVLAARAESVPVHLHATPAPVEAVTAAVASPTSPAGRAVVAWLAPLVGGAWGAYVRAAAVLGATLWHQATGRGLGGHAPALPYQIEALTLRGIPLAVRTADDGVGLWQLIRSGPRVR
jgi:hypothetical protein